MAAEVVKRQRREGHGRGSSNPPSTPPPPPPSPQLQSPLPPAPIPHGREVKYIILINNIPLITTPRLMGIRDATNNTEHPPYEDATIGGGGSPPLEWGSAPLRTGFNYVQLFLIL